MQGIKVKELNILFQFLLNTLHLLSLTKRVLLWKSRVFTGIWSRDIRYKSNLPLTEINKILKNLESKKLIKAVKSVAVSRSNKKVLFCTWKPEAFNCLKSLNCCIQASKKKVYMLYNLQPDRSVTGGAWYSDQDFESEFVEVLNQQCFKFLQSKVRKIASMLLQLVFVVFLSYKASAISSDGNERRQCTTWPHTHPWNTVSLQIKKERNI